MLTDVIPEGRQVGLPSVQNDAQAESDQDWSVQLPLLNKPPDKQSPLSMQKACSLQHADAAALMLQGISGALVEPSGYQHVEEACSTRVETNAQAKTLVMDDGREDIARQVEKRTDDARRIKTKERKRRVNQRKR